MKSPVYGVTPDKSGLAGFIRRGGVARRFIFGGHDRTEFDRQNSLRSRTIGRPGNAPVDGGLERFYPELSRARPLALI